MADEYEEQDDVQRVIDALRAAIEAVRDDPNT